MPTPTTNSGPRDNHARGMVAVFLRAKIKDGSRLSVVSAYFTIYAYDALKDWLNNIDHLDFLFGEPSFINRLDPTKPEKKAFIIDAKGLELVNKLQQKGVAKDEAGNLIRKSRYQRLIDEIAKSGVCPARPHLGKNDKRFRWN